MPFDDSTTRTLCEESNNELQTVSLFSPLTRLFESIEVYGCDVPTFLFLQQRGGLMDKTLACRAACIEDIFLVVNPFFNRFLA